MFHKQMILLNVEDHCEVKQYLEAHACKPFWWTFNGMKFMGDSVLIDKIACI